MAISPGTRLGAYEVGERLGVGGMGEVYRARDTKLNRDVALKVLPGDVSADPERLARFKREAEVLASLNHPNIAQIYGLEDSTETDALVLELVEGPTLADRIARGAIPLDEALPIARQIAEALEAAHEQGIIHRDLKPANVKVTPDGVVKVLDFGLARAMSPDGAGRRGRSGGSGASGEGDPAESPTMTHLRRDSGGNAMGAAATRAGLILGTAGYMSPEQAKGKAVDRRTDVWAFGVVLYEMLTGRPAFGTSDASEALARVLTHDVDVASVPRETQAPIRRLLRRCLARDPRQRLADMSAARLEIEEAISPPAPKDDSDVPDRPSSRRLGLAGAVALAVGAMTLGALVAWSLMAPTSSTELTRYAIVMPEGDRVTSQGGLALSPDGQHVVWGGRRDGVQQLFVRTRDQLDPVPLPGTEGAVHPFFSPDGEWVGFFTSDALRKVPVAGGPVVTICATGNRQGATWGPDGTIVFSSSAAPGLMRVPATGGTPEPLIELEADEIMHLWPEFVPGGRAVVYTSSQGQGVERKRIAVVSLDSGERRTLVEGTTPRIAGSGHLVFARDATLWAVPFDLDRLELDGTPMPVVTGVQVNPGRNWALYDVADDGTLTYLPGGASSIENALVTVDRGGAVTRLHDAALEFGQPRFSPDGESIAVEVAGDIWILHVERGTLTRITTGGGFSPAWTPDGRRIAYATDGRGLLWTSVDASDEPALLMEERYQVSPGSWSPDGAALAITVGPPGARDIWMLTRDGNAAAFLQSPFDEVRPEISPDGQWLAYVSDESDRPEVYLRPYAEAGGRVQVSTSGGSEPAWSNDGTELFYRTADGDLMVVDVLGEPSLSVGLPRRLLAGDDTFRFAMLGATRYYDVSPDGERFVMLQGWGGGDLGIEFARSEIHVVHGWLEELRVRVPN